MKHEKLEPPTHDEIDRLIADGDARALSAAVIAASLDDPDIVWTARLCVSLSAHADESVRGNAVLGLAHLARRFRMLPSLDEAASVVRAALADGHEHVRSHADSAADDLESYVGARVRLDPG